MRLTNHIKETIIANAIKTAGITAEHESIRQRRADWAEAVRVKACGGEDGVRASSSVTLLADDPLVAQFHEIENDQRELNDKRTNIIANLRAVLDKVTTDKALVKQWPEAVELLPSSSEAVKATLPALPVADLNQMIGLPTGGSAE